jgi:putative endonuclease
MSTVSTGNRAEQTAAEYLVRLGYEILEMNYRRPHCEIDIVARQAKVVYFVEVKYRATGSFGGGLDYILQQKLRHMQRAAETWVRERGWGGEYTLSAIEVGGSDFEVLEFVEDVWV